MRVWIMLPLIPHSLPTLPPTFFFIRSSFSGTASPAHCREWTRTGSEGAAGRSGPQAESTGLASCSSGTRSFPAGCARGMGGGYGHQCGIVQCGLRQGGEAGWQRRALSTMQGGHSEGNQWWCGVYKCGKCGVNTYLKFRLEAPQRVHRVQEGVNTCEEVWDQHAPLALP